MGGLGSVRLGKQRRPPRTIYPRYSLCRFANSVDGKLLSVLGTYLDAGEVVGPRTSDLLDAD